MLESLVNGFNPSVIPKLVIFLQFTIWIFIIAVVLGIITTIATSKYFNSKNVSKLKETLLISLGIVTGIIALLSRLSLLVSLVIIVMSFIYKL